MTTIGYTSICVVIVFTNLDRQIRLISLFQLLDYFNLTAAHIPKIFYTLRINLTYGFE